MTLTATGRNGTLKFDGHFLTIAREGFIAKATQGANEKRIPLANIQAIQFKPAGKLTLGFISITLAGGREVQSKALKQASRAGRDENSIIFGHKANDGMLEIRDAVETAIINKATPQSHFASASLADELEKLANLKAQGLISEDDYQQTKNRLLNS